jgi:tetratricopeptide (TPR) repeat protein
VACDVLTRPAPPRRRHAEYFAEFVHDRKDRLYGPGREGTLDELGTELGNLLAAWRYWVEAREPEQLNALLDGLWALHDARGWYHAAIELANDLLEVLAAVPSTPERLREEIALRTSLARGLLAVRGYTEEAEQNYERALALARETGDAPQRAPVVRRLASFYFYRGDFHRAKALGRELLDLAEAERDPALQVDGELVYGASAAFLGDVASGMEHLDRAMALFDPQRYLEGSFRFGTSPGAAAHTTSALLEWLRGNPDRSAQIAMRAVDLVHELDHPFTTAYTLFHVAVLDLWRRKLSVVEERAGRVLDIAEQHGYQIWKAVALMLQGAAAAGLGRPTEGIETMERGVALYEGLTTPAVFWPLVLSVRARGFAVAGRPDDALPFIESAIEAAGTGAVIYPEFGVLRGELLIALGDTESAMRELHHAFETAGRLGLRMPQLRAATRLARVRPADAVGPLRGVYETFPEVLDDVDLVEARAALAELDVPVG